MVKVQPHQQFSTVLTQRHVYLCTKMVYTLHIICHPLKIQRSTGGNRKIVVVLDLEEGMKGEGMDGWIRICVTSNISVVHDNKHAHCSLVGMSVKNKN